MEVNEEYWRGHESDLALFNDEDKLRRVCGARLERAVSPWRVKYPHVQARTSLVLSSPRDALFQAAEQADLVVVGNRGAGGLDALRLGAISAALLQHAPLRRRHRPGPHE